MHTSAVEKDGLGSNMETGIAAKTPVIGIGGGVRGEPTERPENHQCLTKEDRALGKTEASKDDRKSCSTCSLEGRFCISESMELQNFSAFISMSALMVNVPPTD